MKSRIFVVILWSMACSTFISAQDDTRQSKFNFSISVGYPIGIFDLPKSGYHAAANVTYPFNDYFELEGQVSFTGMKFNRATNTFAHDGGEIKNFNLLGGIRIYVLSHYSNVRPYINFLMGYGNGINNEYNDQNTLIKSTTGPLGYSAAFNVEIKTKYLVAVSIEGPTANIVAKVGYQF